MEESRMMLGQGDSPRCIIPRSAEIKNAEDLERAVGSHEWSLDIASDYSHDSKGVLVRLSCKKCGAHRVMILTSI